MSKSLGNTIEPQEIIAKSGAEIIRLWVAMVDYREEIRIGPEFWRAWSRRTASFGIPSAILAAEPFRLRSVERSGALVRARAG